MVIPPPPPGVTKAIIGPAPLREIIVGIMLIGSAIVAGSISSFFGPIAIITGILGVALLALGAMGISIPEEQVTYQQGPTQSYGQAARTMYDDNPTGLTRRCPRCGGEIPLSAIAGYHCGAVLP